MDFVVVEAEGLPDVEGARRVFGLAPELENDAVVRVLFHHHQERHDRHPFVEAHLRAIAAVSVVRCRDEVVQVETLSAETLSEPLLIGALSEQSGRPGNQVVYWDGGRSLAAWVGVRALIHGATLQDPLSGCLERRLGLGETAPGRCDLARRLAISCDAVPSDEDNWRSFRDAGPDAIAERCARNAAATARLFLRHRLVAGELSKADYQGLDEQLKADMPA